MAEESLSSLHTEIAHHLLTGRHRQQNKTTSTFKFKTRISHPQKTYGELPEDLRRHYKEHIFPNINRELQPFFESDRRGELVTIATYMVGKSKTTLIPTVLFIGGDVKTREGAKKVIEKSQIMAQYPTWQLDHTADFPRLSEMCNEESLLEDFEFWSSKGVAKWRDQNNDTNLARDVYLDLQPYRGKTLVGRGLPIYIQQPSGLRLATANIVRLNNRTFLQTVYHAFCLRDNKTETPGPTPQPKDTSTLPSANMLNLIGHLLVWSEDRDWALIEVSNDEMNSLMNSHLVEDKEAHWVFQSAGRPSSVKPTAYTWTATNGKLEVVLSETTTYMKLPNSASFQEIHRAHLKNGLWSNGDSGATIVDLATKVTFGHVLGGSRSKGVAFVLAADQVVEDFQQLDFSSHLHEICEKNAHTPKLTAGSTVFETGELAGTDSSQSFPVPFTQVEVPRSVTVATAGGNSYSAPGQINASIESSSIIEETADAAKRRTILASAKEGEPATFSGSSQISELNDLHLASRDEGDTLGIDSAGDQEYSMGKDNEQAGKLLLVKGLDLNANGGKAGEAALYDASTKGHEQVLKLLLDSGVPINGQNGILGMAALQAASAKGFHRVVKLLLDRGVNVDAGDGLFYNQALGYALDGNHDRIVNLLLSRGVDVKTQGGRHGGTLQAARAKGNEQEVKLLLGRSAGYKSEDTSY